MIPRPPRPSAAAWFLLAVGLIELGLVLLLINDVGARV